MSGVPIRRVEDHFEGARGLTLLRRAWLPPEPERTVVLVHGFAEHSGRYEHLGTWLAERGCAVHGYDQRGHGRSEGERGHVERFAEFLDDLDDLLELAREGLAGRPLFVVGHSMGGLVVARWLVDRQPRIVGAVTSGAALALAGAPSPFQSWMLRALRRVMPRARRDPGIPPSALSRDEDVQRAYVADPLVFSGMTLSLAAEFTGAAKGLVEGAARVTVPVLLLHGADDPLCAASGSEAFHAALSTEGSALRVYPGLRHEIFNEPEQEQVFADALEWMRKREASWQKS